jgi:hypothetical protein
VEQKLTHCKSLSFLRYIETKRKAIAQLGGEAMTKWEYMAIALFEECKKAGTTDQKKVLDKYGDEGWELVSVSAIGIKNRFDIVAYFKREKE